jgi:hypothetical protein
MNKLNLCMLYPSAEIKHLKYNDTYGGVIHLIISHEQSVKELLSDAKIKLRKPDSLTEEEKEKLLILYGAQFGADYIKCQSDDKYISFGWETTYGSLMPPEYGVDRYKYLELPVLIADYLRSINIFIDYHLGEEFIKNNIEWGNDVGRR